MYVTYSRQDSICLGYYIFVDTKLCAEEIHSHVFVYTFKVNITSLFCGLYCHILERIHIKQYIYTILNGKQLPLFFGVHMQQKMYQDPT